MQGSRAGGGSRGRQSPRVWETGGPQVQSESQKTEAGLESSRVAWRGQEKAGSRTTPGKDLEGDAPRLGRLFLRLPHTGRGLPPSVLALPPQRPPTSPRPDPRSPQPSCSQRFLTPFLPESKPRPHTLIPFHPNVLSRKHTLASLSGLPPPAPRFSVGETVWFPLSFSPLPTPELS